MEKKWNDTELTASLAKNTLDEIPKPKADAKEIVGLIRHSGKVDGYQLSETEYLKSIPDGSESNNLGSLPTVSG